MPVSVPVEDKPHMIGRSQELMTDKPVRIFAFERYVEIWSGDPVPIRVDLKTWKRWVQPMLKKVRWIHDPQAIDRELRMLANAATVSNRNQVEEAIG